MSGQLGEDFFLPGVGAGQQLLPCRSHGQHRAARVVGHASLEVAVVDGLGDEAACAGAVDAELVGDIGYGYGRVVAGSAVDSVKHQDVSYSALFAREVLGHLQDPASRPEPHKLEQRWPTSGVGPMRTGRHVCPVTASRCLAHLWPRSLCVRFARISVCEVHTSPVSLAAGSASRRQTELAFAALLIGMLMAQLDSTVVVAALPQVGLDLGSPAAVAGVTAAYLLTVTVSTPVHGALGDRLGRRAGFVLALALFAAGSMACAVAASMPALIGARALQGVGGGGLVVTAVSALGQMFDRTELARRQIWLTAVFAVSGLAGPPLGGLLAAGPGWRWIFAVNLPLCVLALLLGRALPSAVTGARGLANFDVAGSLLVGVAGAGVVALGSLGWAANDPATATALLVVSVVAAVLFVRMERRAASPLIPPRLFGVPALARSIGTTALSGMALFGTFAFIPLALAESTGAGTARIGTLLLALTGGWVVSTVTFSLLAKRLPRLTGWGHAALGLGVLGLALLTATLHLSTPSKVATTAVAVLALALCGAALGMSMQAYTLLGLATAPSDSFGAAMATLTFARQLGGSLGAAAFGWLLLTFTDRVMALTVVLGAAAAVCALALVVAPRRSHDPAVSDGHPG